MSENTTTKQSYEIALKIVGNEIFSLRISKRIMEECMTRAIQHNFNRLAFARMRKEKISLKSL